MKQQMGVEARCCNHQNAICSGCRTAATCSTPRAVMGSVNLWGRVVPREVERQEDKMATTEQHHQRRLGTVSCCGRGDRIPIQTLGISES